MKLNETRLLIVACAALGLLALGCGDSGGGDCETDAQETTDTTVAADTTVATDTAVATDTGKPPADTAVPPGDTTPPPGDSQPPDGPATCDTDADCSGANCSATEGFECTCFQIPNADKICVPLCVKSEDCPALGITLVCNGGMCTPEGQGGS